MPYIANNPASYNMTIVPNGQCVAFVRAASGAPMTSSWKEGIIVKGNTNIREGTAIATFIHGVYPSLPTGNHAAIYIKQDSEGILVWDQWVGHPVQKRHIRFKEGNTDRVNNGNAFSVIEMK